MLSITNKVEDGKSVLNVFKVTGHYFNEKCIVVTDVVVPPKCGHNIIYGMTLSIELQRRFMIKYSKQWIR